MGTFEKIQSDLIEALNSSKKTGTTPYDTEAQVVRVDGSTAWVHIPGGVDETPVSMTVNSKAGDTVRVRVSGGTAWITGNDSAPPTDDEKAIIANETAIGADLKATTALDDATLAKLAAESAAQIAGDTAQHFWFTEAGTDTGAHITEISQEDFEDDPTNGGANLLARTNGIAVRDGLTELATFGANGVIIGTNASGKTRTEIDSDGMQIYRNVNGTDHPIANLGYGLGNDGEGGQSYAPFYTFGERPTAYAVGNYSVAEGESGASGYLAHSEGQGTLASGERSHAEGYGTVAASNDQHVFGILNVPDINGTYVEIVGNGIANPGQESTHNARTLDWNGNEVLAGKLTLGAAPTANMNAATKKYVDDAISSLQSTLTTLISGSINTYAPNSSITNSRGQLRVCKIGSTVFVMGGIGNATSTVGTSTNLFAVMAATYRPSANVTIQGWVNDAMANFTVMSTGYIRQTLSSDMNNCFFAGFYHV